MHVRARAAVLWRVLAGGVLAGACSGGGGITPLDAGDAPDVEVDAPDVAIDAPSPDGPFDPLTCGTGTTVLPLPASHTATGMAMASTPGNIASVSCFGRGAETVYVVTVDHAVTMIATTDLPGTTLDTVLYLRRSCLDETTELGCNDNASDTSQRSTLTVDLTAGTYYLVVDGRNVGSAGLYELQVNFYEGLGAPCDDPGDCAPGYTCRAIPPSTQTTCERHACGDGRDDDGDGRIDYPADPGCVDTADDSEVDACPSGAGCPACADGADNDADGRIDYPMDPGCQAASSDSEEDCTPEDDPLGFVTMGTSTGTTAGAMNDYQPVCGGGSGPDQTYILRVRFPLASLTIDTEGSTFDTILSLYDSTCTTALVCDDDAGAGSTSLLTRTNVAMGTYAVVVDSFAAAGGSYTLHVRGTYAAGTACDPAAPYFTCTAGFTCAGPPSLERCVPAACNDTLDADGDGFPGYPTDPGCASISDPDETDSCPSGPGCPACSDDLDNDGDGAIDYPLDTGCIAASTPAETDCQGETDPLLPVTMPATPGTTAGATNNLAPTCGSMTVTTAPDRVHVLALQAPLATLHIDTNPTGFDNTITLSDVTCGPSIQCADTPTIDRTNVAPGIYTIVVDGWSTGSGSYTLNVRGTIMNGASCADPLVAAGVLTCGAGHACSGGPSPVCAPSACNDTVDADGDGFPGYPTDPGCISISDPDETDTCPAGPGCPACSDDLDNDGDGTIDYPADTGCGSAAGTTELGCPAEMDPVTAIVGPTTTGTTVGASNDFNPTCQMSDLGDRVHTLRLGVPVATLVLDTEGSTMSDPILQLMNESCAPPPIACDDDSGTATQALITRTNVPAGNYTIVVDQYTGSTTGPYQLHVRGTLPAGGSCADPLVAAGVLACPAGQTCQAGLCAP